MAVKNEQAWETEVHASVSIPSLHQHQIDAIQELLDGKDVFLSVCKSMCYLIKATEKHTLFAFSTTWHHLTAKY